MFHSSPHTPSRACLFPRHRPRSVPQWCSDAVAPALVRLPVRLPVSVTVCVTAPASRDLARAPAGCTTPAARCPCPFRVTSQDAFGQVTELKLPGGESVLDLGGAPGAGSVWSASFVGAGIVTVSCTVLTMTCSYTQLGTVRGCPAEPPLSRSLSHTHTTFAGCAPQCSLAWRAVCRALTPNVWGLRGAALACWRVRRCACVLVLAGCLGVRVDLGRCRRQDHHIHGQRMRVNPTRGPADHHVRHLPMEQLPRPRRRRAPGDANPFFASSSTLAPLAQCRSSTRLGRHQRFQPHPSTILEGSLPLFSSVWLRARSLR